MRTFVGRMERLQKWEGDIWEEVVRERVSGESDDKVYSRPWNNLYLSRYGEEFVDEDKLGATILRAAVSSRDGRITDRLLTTIWPPYLIFVFIIEVAVLKYCSRDACELVPFISELRRCWDRRSEEAEDFIAHWKGGTLFAISNCFENTNLISSTRNRSAVSIHACGEYCSMKEAEESVLAFTH